MADTLRTLLRPVLVRIVVPMRMAEILSSGGAPPAETFRLLAEDGRAITTESGDHITTQ